ncbi:tetratricopeptide repeat protein [Sediminitomix flava]|uniref:Anaphase-promoting complex subunit 3 n=1 Tax=Sediminitomix flava TaxID=379075 RepID=A0A315Z9K0_SEDFL|nr:CDC27 family protein [Sediminitomix flava]PWJ41869.1 anaphase-promoting complex subunit 3 [Sediminitomix flava]
MSNKQTRIDSLFEELRNIKDQRLIKQTEEQILAIWLESEDELIKTLMEKGLEFMKQKEYRNAITLFSEVIVLKPTYSEGWNKRATAFYLTGEYKKAIYDIRNTLKLEERHFGAMSGLIAILIEMKFYEEAIKQLEKIKYITPNRKGVNEQIVKLRTRLSC